MSKGSPGTIPIFAMRVTICPSCGMIGGFSFIASAIKLKYSDALILAMTSRTIFLGVYAPLVCPRGGVYGSPYELSGVSLNCAWSTCTCARSVGVPSEYTRPMMIAVLVGDCTSVIFRGTEPCQEGPAIRRFCPVCPEVREPPEWMTFVQASRIGNRKDRFPMSG